MAHVVRGERRQMKVRGGQEEGRRSDTGRENGQRREVKQWQKGKRKSMQSLINSNSPRLHGELSLQSFFPPFHFNISFPHLPLSVLIFLCSTPPISYLSFSSTLIFTALHFSLQLDSTLSALSSQPSHFLAFQHVWFLSTKHSISHLLQILPVCLKLIVQILCTKVDRDSLMLTDDLMRLLKTGLYPDNRSVFDVRLKRLSVRFWILPYRHLHRVVAKMPWHSLHTMFKLASKLFGFFLNV